jgi:hypothetical protein
MELSEYVDLKRGIFQGGKILEHLLLGSRNVVGLSMRLEDAVPNGCLEFSEEENLQMGLIQLAGLTQSLWHGSHAMNFTPH